MERCLLVEADARGPKRIHREVTLEGIDVLGKEGVVKGQLARTSAEDHRKEWSHRSSENGQ